MALYKVEWSGLLTVELSLSVRLVYLEIIYGIVLK